MGTAFHKNFKFRFVGLAFIFSLALICMGLLYYSNEKKPAQKESYDMMKTVSTLKANQLVQWYKERLSEVRFFSSNFPYTEYANEIAKGNNRSAAMFRNSLSQIMTSKRYENIFLLSKEGRLIFSVDPAFDFVDTTTVVFSKKVVESGEISIRDLYFCNVHKKIHFEIITPVDDHNGKVIAALVFLVDPEDYLYPLIKQWPIPGKTAETYIVRLEGDTVTYLSNLLHLPNSALLRSFPLSTTKIKAVHNVQGFEGIFEGIDYRGEKVLADIRKIPDSSWFIVSQIDTREIYSDLKREAVLITILTLFMILFVSAIMAWLYHFRQQNIYKELLNKSNELYQSQEELGATLYSIGDGVITTDKEGLVKNLNPVAERLTGWTEDEAKGKPIDQVFQIINEDTREKIESPVEKVLHEGKIVDLANHTLLISKSGTEIPIADSGAPIKNEKGDILGVVMVFSDQSEQRFKQRQIEESEEKYRAMVTQMQLGLAIHEMIFDDNGAPVDYCFMDVNPSYERLTGLKRDYIIGKTVLEVLPNTEKIWIEKFGRVVLSGESITFENYSTELNKYFSVLAYKNRPNQFAVIVEDVTHRKQTELALQKRLEYEQLISRISGLAVSNISLEEFLGKCVEDIGSTMNISRSYIFKHNHDTDTMDNTFEWCNSGLMPQINELQEIPSNAIPWWMATLTKGENICYSNIEDIPDEGAKEILRFQGILSVLVVPLFLNGKYYGFFGFDECTYLRQWPQEDVDLLFSITQIITGFIEREQGYLALLESENKYRRITENISDVVWTADLNLNTTYISQSIEHLLGESPEEHLKRTMEEKLPPGSLQKIYSVISEELEKEKKPGCDRKRSRIFEVEHYCADKSLIWVSMNVSFLRDEKGNPIGFQGITRDITARKKAEFDLQESERNYRELIDNMNETVWVIDFSGDLIDVNESATKVLGYTKEEILSIGLFSIDSSLKREMITALVQNMSKEKIQIFETSHKAKSGRIFPVEIYSSLVHYKGKEAILSIARDITERKRMEKKLRDSEETIRLLFNSTAEGIYGIDTDGNCTFCNSAALNMLGYSVEEEIIGQNMHNLIHHTNNDGSACAAEECRIYKAFRDGAGTHADDEMLWRKDGSGFPAEYWSYPITRDEKIIGSVVTFVDITKRRHDEEVQQALYEIARTSISARTTEELLEVVREELSKVLDATNFQVALYHSETGSLNKIFFANEKPGTDEWPAENILSEEVLKTGRALLLKGEEIARFMVSHHHQPDNIPFKCWLGVPLIDGDKPIGIMVLQSDTSESAYSLSSARLLEMMAYELTVVVQRSKMIEDLIMAKEKAEESDRLKSAFLANVSHEIRTPMNGILGFLELLTEPGLESKEKERYLDIMNKSGQRLLETINAIVEMAKIESGQVDVHFSEVNVPQIMKDQYDFFQQQTSAKGLELEITEQITGRKAVIRTDKFKLDAILTNLLNNAVKYTREGRIEFGNYAKDGDLVFYIKDTGVGIPSHRIDSIFERFIQTDIFITRPQEGAGLGLSIVKAYIEMLKGKIWVESELGKGSVFFFSIPYRTT